MSACTISAVIPTRNRPDDLAKAVASVLLQKRLPDEFIIIDQSPGDESRLLVESLMRGHQEQMAAASRKGPDSIRLIYVHDTKIAGLVEAKKVAAQKSGGDIICYLEDDVVLEPEYIANIESGFIQRPDMLGCCGVMTNMPRMPFGYVFFFQLFHRGIFSDDRVSVLYKDRGSDHCLFPCSTICGGLSAWRREVFSAIPFDVVNGFHMFEDVDFSTRVAVHFGPHLYINPGARAEHHWSPVNREVRRAFYHRKLQETIVFYKKRAHLPGAKLQLLWLLVGLLLEAGLKSVVHCSAYPISGCVSGLRAGISREILPCQL